MHSASPVEWPGQRRTLAWAVLLSLLLHVLLLAAWRAPRKGASLQPALVVTLTGAFVVPQRPQVAPVAAAQPPIARAQPPAASAATEPVAPARRARAAPAHAASAPVAETPRSEAVASARTRDAPGEAVASARAPAARADLTFYRADQLSQGPVPQDDPAAQQLAAAHLVGRRLVVTVFVDAQGAVREAHVAPYEISEQQAALLQQAVAAVRFAPASMDGKPVAAQVQSRLCFDDAGLLDTTSPGCWRFDPQPAH